jgi:alpha-galactosidase
VGLQPQLERAGLAEQKPEDQQKVYVAYVQNLYWILQHLRERHPKLEIESCSGGGGRVDSASCA